MLFDGFRRDHVYGVHGRFIAYTLGKHITPISRNELRRGRRKRGPYESISS